MLYQAKTLHGYKLNSLEGEIGKVKGFYFDDYYWTIRYLVADTGNWMSGRHVLIPAQFLANVNKDAQDINIRLTKKQIEDSPPLNSDKPVSRQFEEAHYKYFAVPTYWETPSMFGLRGSAIGSLPLSERHSKSPGPVKRLIPICAALSRLPAITSRRKMEISATSRILLSMMILGISVI